MCLKSHPGLAAGAGFLFIMITGMVFGRVYCSFLCPLGILQDIFIRLSSVFGIKKTHAFQKPHTRIRYSIAVVMMVAFLGGVMDMVGLFDPLSLFGRGTAHIFKPAALTVHNMAVSVLERFDIYILPVKKNHFVPMSIGVITVCSFVIVLFFSFFHGRLYCNTICPAGVLTGIISRRSLFRLGLDGTKCTSCGACEKVCKAGCIDVMRMTIDSNRCIACFNCLDACGKKAVSYDIATRQSTEKTTLPAPHVPGRRYWLAGSLAAGTSVILSLFPLTRLSKVGLRENTPVLPPGSVSAAHLRASCLGCHLCVSVCPTNVLVPGGTCLFAQGLLMPGMDFNKGFCDPSCHACGQACPAGAIRAMPLHQKKQVRVGSAVLHKDLCIVHVKKKHCGACGEACPSQAISPVENGRVLFPELNPAYCIGCGACEYACPAKPKAIVIKAVLIHEKAKSCQPVKKPVITLPSPNTDFPF